MSGARALVVGLDGAGLGLIRPLAASGRLPTLGRWLAGGGAVALRSTVPAMTFPAWSSLLTGLGPGRHGIFDFTQKVPGAYRIRLVSARDRSGATLLDRVSASGGRVLCLGMPATYPPPPVRGLVVPGFDAPVSSGSEPGATNDPSLYRSIEARTGPWSEAGLDEVAGEEGWHERALAELLRRIERKTAFAIEAIRRLCTGTSAEPELAIVVFSESDTVAHHFWRDHDPRSPRHDPGAPAWRRQAVARVYERLDAALAELVEAFGEPAERWVVSDHGSGGASRWLVHLNRRLEECGLLARRAGAAGRSAAWVRAGRDRALRALGPRRAQWLFRRTRASAARIESWARFGGLDWARTLAFSEEANTQPGVWINLAGREEHGCVAPADYERVRDEVIAALLDWRLPGGQPVIARARRREEVYRGPWVGRAPDIVVELGDEDGYRHSLVPTPWGRRPVAALRAVEPGEFAGGRGRGLNGVHEPQGVWIWDPGPATAAVRAPAASIEDVAPTLLARLGIGANPDLDGRPLAAPPLDYTPEQEARVTARLRALGYLE